jgi:tellurite resistance protein TerC
VLLAVRWDLSSNKGKPLSIKQATLRTLMWLSIGLSFSIALYYGYHWFCGFTSVQQLAAYQVQYGGNFVTHGDFALAAQEFNKASAILFLSGFFIEYALSMDNLFVILLIFGSYKVAPQNQRKLLSYGVWGAIIMRFIFIFAGSAVVQKFHWVLYVFAIFLIYSGLKIMLTKQEDEDFNPNDSKLVRFANKLLKVKEGQSHDSFWFKENGVLFFTPLFLILIVIEFTDVIFAVDSVPAIFGITQDPYLVFFANIFAIIGLRSLFFVLGASMDKFYALQYGLSLVLIFIGFKMLFEPWFQTIGFTHMHNLLTLIGILGVSILTSVVFPRKQI